MSSSSATLKPEKYHTFNVYFLSRYLDERCASNDKLFQHGRRAYFFQEAHAKYNDDMDKAGLCPWCEGEYQR